MAADFDATTSTTARTVTRIWTTELGVPALDPDLFLPHAGATSARTLRAHRALRTALARDIPLTALFRHPTIRTLTAYLDAAPH
ncbi:MULTISPECIES: acyl carrier protein [unclassified Streptomyces]|uniref:acyl carrier protein n=1 Tax=unclassified Streptomyces TaxID=2593676 RepID=UPI00135779DB|nr:acyl carrier protein [Streptomyces sp. WAC05374]